MRQVSTGGPIEEVRDLIARALEPLGGFCDGSISRAAVFTSPLRDGFQSIERAFAKVASGRDEMEWFFDNVYEDDGTTPLRWWSDLPRE